jgi:uncharacterized protein
VTPAFADTSFFLALLRDDDELHALAIEQWKVTRPVVTTEFIVLELGNACARAEDHDDFLALVAGIRTNSRIRVLPLATSLLDRGLDRMSRRPDKDWSLTDCISFVVMEDERIQEALTGDRDFEQAGFVALLKP